GEAERLHAQMSLRYNEASVYWDGRLANDPADTEAQRWRGILLHKRALEARLLGRIRLGAAEVAQGGGDLEKARQERLAALTAFERSRDLNEQSLAALTPLAEAATASGEAARDILLCYDELGKT